MIMTEIQRIKKNTSSSLLIPSPVRIPRATVYCLFLLVSSCLPVSVTAQTEKSQTDFKPPNGLGLSPADVKSGWIALFDGETLYGWKPEPGKAANWNVTDGQIQANEGETSLLRTTSQFDNFMLRLEFKCSESSNSGVFLRTSPQPKNPSSDCYELNIAAPSDPFPTGSLVGRKRTQRRQEPARRGWNQLNVIAQGNRITASLNGTKTMDYVDPQPLGKGYIGLQFKSGNIAFRNVHLKPLDLKPMIDQNLRQWKLDQQLESQFTVQPDDRLVLNIQGGKGQIETRLTYADFVFQMECRTNAPGLNSGVFFRCIPDDLMNGYESQIQNQYQNGDRKQIVDCGTGGIFRRQNARCVTADDLAWFSKTIVASGPHISVWVNGYQVTDWSDQRKPDANPRRGRRLAAGTIILQGHDPTTNIDFRGLGVREITTRRPR